MSSYKIPPLASTALADNAFLVVFWADEFMLSGDRFGFADAPSDSWAWILVQPEGFDLHGDALLEGGLF